VGVGGIGLATLLWALQQGGARVTVADPDPQRRDIAGAMGATDVLVSASEAEPGAYDVVTECVGRPELLRACQPALRPRGRLVVSGACAEPTTIEPVTALLRELTIRYSARIRSTSSARSSTPSAPAPSTQHPRSGRRSASPRSPKHSMPSAMGACKAESR
jgi:threonine dehydrogenase-like Zn-dependent dehydrogenase